MLHLLSYTGVEKLTVTELRPYRGGLEMKILKILVGIDYNRQQHKARKIQRIIGTCGTVQSKHTNVGPALYLKEIGLHYVGIYRST